MVDADGAYIGGSIAPGVNLSLEALHQAAAALPHVDIYHSRKGPLEPTQSPVCNQAFSGAT